MSKGTDENVNNEQELEPMAAPTEIGAQAETSDGSPAQSRDVELTVVQGSGGDDAGTEGGHVKTARFAPLPRAAAATETGSMDILLDVQLELTVELGRASVPVREVLQLGPGAIVKLDKLAGEPVDVLVNGKLIARGEVVVVDETFGIRIAELVNRADSAAQAS